MTYKIQIENGFAYAVSFDYNGRKYENNIINIGNAGYQVLLAKAHLSKKLHFDISDNILKKHLTREGIVDSRGVFSDLSFHSQCVLFVFKIMEKIIKTYGRNFLEYCFYVRKLAEDDQLQATFDGFFLLKAYHLLIRSNFEYSVKIEPIDDIGSLW